MREVTSFTSGTFRTMVSTRLTILSDTSNLAPVGNSIKIVNLFCSVLPRYSKPNLEMKNIAPKNAPMQMSRTRRRWRMDRKRNRRSTTENFLTHDSPSSDPGLSANELKAGLEHIIGTSVTAQAIETNRETTIVE